MIAHLLVATNCGTVVVSEAKIFINSRIANNIPVNIFPHLDLYSLSFEAVRLGVEMKVSFWQVSQQHCFQCACQISEQLDNLKPILGFCSFARFGGKMLYRLMTRGPEVTMCCLKLLVAYNAL